MKNYLHEGQILKFTAGANYSSGDPVVLGAMVGIVLADVLSGAVGQALVKKVVSVSKVSAQAWAMGQRVYWDASLALFTTLQDADTVYAGVAAAAASNPSGTGELLLAGVGAPQAAVVAAVATADADAVYGQPEADLINELKAQVNALLVAMKNAGLMASS